MSARVPLAVLCLAATAGLLFASVSTIDFVAHLDRQVHELHCSFVPGLVSENEHSEGCKLTLMSPYSSVLRRSQWGGLPISLPAMAVFAFLLFRSIDLFGRPQGQRRTGATILLVGTLVPVFASLTMGWIAMNELDAACKLCIGIYASSAVAFAAALWAKLAIGQDPAPVDPAAPAPAGPAPGGGGLPWVVAAAQLGGFVALPAVAYIAIAPDFSKFVGSCGQLETMDDPYGVLVPLDTNASGTPTVEVLDPLCPACKAFEERLDASGLEPKLHRVGLLFPLDDSCNWMVSKSLHPGACAVSEAILCAHRKGMPVGDVLSWAFENQAQLLAAEKNKPGAVAEHVAQKFGALASCLGSAEVQADLNKSLRWAVAHELPVMTPQLYVGGVKVCDEDTDLGLEWALSQVLEKQASGGLPIVRPSATPAPAKAAGDEDSAPAARERAPSAGDTAPRAKKTATAKTEPAAKPVQPEPTGKPVEPEPAAKPTEPEPEPKAEPGPGGDAPTGKLPSVEEIPPPKPDAPSEEDAP
jgi:uncharacterized membrane protein